MELWAFNSVSKLLHQENTEGHEYWLDSPTLILNFQTPKCSIDGQAKYINEMLKETQFLYRK